MWICDGGIVDFAVELTARHRHANAHACAANAWT
jgi:hypothetical protein